MDPRASKRQTPEAQWACSPDPLNPIHPHCDRSPIVLGTQASRDCLASSLKPRASWVPFFMLTNA